jgi:tetratricopeptide (TPR) repeat protein
MKIDPILNKAVILARKRNYEGALKILTDEEERYYGSYKYHYLYGLICLHAANYVEAKTFFERARKIKPKGDASLMLGFAILNLKRMDTVQAIDYYLDVQEIDPKNRIAKKALGIIRKHSGGEALSDWMSENLSKLFPPVPLPAVNAKKIVNSALIIAAVFAVSFVIFSRVNLNSGFFKSKNTRPTNEFNLTSQEKNAPVQVDGVYSYILTRDQAIDLYGKALSLFKVYRDEAAKPNLNRILESNASAGLKNRARFLMNSMEIPGFDTFKRADNVSYTDVIREPVIYRDVNVIWRGMSTNYSVTDEYTRFDFLVGYDTRRTLEGIVPVVFNIPVSVNVERPLEVLGKIVMDENSPHGVRLDGVAVHQSGRLEN